MSLTMLVDGLLMRKYTCLLAVLLLTLAATAQRGAKVPPQSIEQLASEAEDIVHVTVTSAKVEPHPQYQNLMTVVVTLDVQETVKGKPRKTMTFRQFIWDPRDRMDGAGYKKGQELLLMLGPTAESGMRSPVGLEQGRFRVLRDAAGQKTAINGAGNVGLFRTTEERAKTNGVKLPARIAALARGKAQGPISLTDLKETARTFAKVRLQ